MLTRNIHLLLTLVLLLVTIPWRASADQLSPFSSDGCSLFPDGQPFTQDVWLHCCTEHDRAYWRGGTYQQRLDADRALYACVVAAGFPEVAEVMLSGVRVGGGPLSLAPYRWGYGWSYLRGYRPLSEAEKAQAEALLPTPATPR